MKIIAGDIAVPVLTLIGENVAFGGQLVESIRVVTTEPLTAEQMGALTDSTWSILDDNGEVLSNQSGFNTLYQHSATFLRVPDLQRENETLKAALAQKEAELKDALGKLETTLAPGGLLEEEGRETYDAGQ